MSIGKDYLVEKIKVHLYKYRLPVQNPLIHGGIIGQLNKFYGISVSMDRSETGSPIQHFSLHSLTGFDSPIDKTFTYLTAIQDKFCFVIIPPGTVMYINNSIKIRQTVNTYYATNERADAYL